MIAIVDSGLGNINSVANMIKKVGGNCAVVENGDQLQDFQKILLPGVGNFRAGMDLLKSGGLDIAIQKKANEGALILGICLGMQLLFDRSEEGDCSGLGLIPGCFVRFNFERDSGLKVPHVGFNRVDFKEHPLTNQLPKPSKFYFTHSYHVHSVNSEYIIGETQYGVTFPCAVAKNNIMGCQFHPEKSHQYGMLLFKNFLEMKCC